MKSKAPKSALCKSWDHREEEEFAQDLAKTLLLDDKVLLLLADEATRVALAPSDTETKSAMQNAARVMGITRADVSSPLRIAGFFLRQFALTGLAVDDKPEDLVDDLVEMDLVPSDRHASFTEFLRHLRKHGLGQVTSRQRRQSAARTGLGHLSGIATSADFRAVFEQKFNVETQFEKYEPRCLGLVPVALISLEFDEGPIKEISFQTDGRALRLLIDHLRAAQRDIQTASETLKLEQHIHQE